MHDRAVILVEGESDQIALTTLATRLGRDLDAEGVSIVVMGGAKNLAKHLHEYGPGGRRLTMAGLIDAAEGRDLVRALERTGFGVDLEPNDAAALGFFLCVADLEDELIRAVGVARVETIIDARGELRALRTLQKQPAQVNRTVAQQLHRFMGSKSGRKREYARRLVEALDLASIPEPLAAVLARVAPEPQTA
jgi:hypothetical protein